MFSLEIESDADGRDMLIADLWEQGSCGIAEPDGPEQLPLMIVDPFERTLCFLAVLPQMLDFERLLKQENRLPDFFESQNGEIEGDVVASRHGPNCFRGLDQTFGVRKTCLEYRFNFQGHNKILVSIV